MSERETSVKDLSMIFVHIIAWGLIFFFPYLMMVRGGMELDFSTYFYRCLPYYTIYISLFYINYSLLVPRYFLKRKYWKYLGLAFLLALVFSTITAFMHQSEMINNFMIFRERIPYEFDFRQVDGAMMRFNLGRDLFVMVLIIGIGLVSRIITAWNQLQVNQHEAEQKRVESELQQLRSQINPHFLLNTLNNIYALISFDSDKAQEAVQELSQLLRHVLYDNKENFTTLQKEMDFMKSYINLMRIRLSGNVNVETTYDMRENNQTPIAPLIFISLVENAFKHGISPTEPSYIKIYFSEKLGYVRCEIKNSNHRKVGYDKSGSGIGLEQVQKRLDLMYPHSYEWHYGLSDDGNEYISSLEINTNNAPSLS